MNDQPMPSQEQGPLLPEDSAIATLRDQVRPAILSTLLLTLLTGVSYPLALAVLSYPCFSHQASGGLISRDGEVVGAEVIGQKFTEPGYFHPRPSAAGDGYDATASGGTNLGPANKKLRDGEAANTSNPESKPFAGIRELADAYRRENGMPADAPVPEDAVTRSGSGLDPHISPLNADIQVTRVARKRRLSEAVLRRLVAEHTEGPQLGFLGESRVAVLPLNLALDRVAPLSAASSK